MNPTAPRRYLKGRTEPPTPWAVSDPRWRYGRSGERRPRPRGGAGKKELPLLDHHQKGEGKVVMSDDVAGHSKGKHLQMIEIRVDGGGIHR
jgi:hypothetical protein